MEYANTLVLLTVISIILSVIIVLSIKRVNKLKRSKRKENETVHKLKLLLDLIYDSVKETQRIQVEKSNDEKVFNIEVRNDVLNNAKDYIVKNITQDMLIFIKSLTPNINQFLEMKIEVAINIWKMENQTPAQTFNVI